MYNFMPKLYEKNGYYTVARYFTQNPDKTGVQHLGKD